MEKYNEFYDFMLEYTELFEEVVLREEEKFKALYSRDAKLLEHIMTEHQVTQTTIETYERNRIELHNKLNLEDKTFKEIINECSGNQKDELSALYERLRIAVENAKSYNKKSLEFAQMNVDIVDSINSDGINDAQCYKADGSSGKKIHNASLLNAKI